MPEGSQGGPEALELSDVASGKLTNELAQLVRRDCGGSLPDDFDLGKLVGIEEYFENGRRYTRHLKIHEPPEEWDKIRKSLGTIKYSTLARAVTSTYKYGQITTLGQLREAKREDLANKRNISTGVVDFVQSAFKANEPVVAPTISSPTDPVIEALRPSDV